MDTRNGARNNSKLMRCGWCDIILESEEAKECVSCMEIDFVAVVKTHCVICGQAIAPTKKRYITQGNYCRPCNAKTTQNPENIDLRETLAQMGIDIYRDL